MLSFISNNLTPAFLIIQDATLEVCEGQEGGEGCLRPKSEREREAAAVVGGGAGQPWFMGGGGAKHPPMRSLLE